VSATADVRDEVREMKRKANQDAAVHAMFAERLEKFDTLLSIPSLLLSSALLTVVFLDPSRAGSLFGLGTQGYTILIGALAISNFGMVIVWIFFKPKEMAQKHWDAVSHYTHVKYDAKQLLERDAVTFEDLVALRARYLENDNVPKIPSSRFLAYKRSHLRTVDISIALSRNPHRSIREIRRELAQQGRPKKSAIDSSDTESKQV